ncbi:MAG: hypothetical protein ACRD8A_12715 [Candidatus Acidiferrales bacterium]
MVEQKPSRFNGHPLDEVSDDNLLTFCIDQQIQISLDADRAELIAAIEIRALKLAESQCSLPR